jgi:phage terminase small subunit
MAADNRLGLTPKQEAFARAYVETGNASEAYRRAYSADKMSEKAVKVQACRLLKHPNIALTLERLRVEHAQRHNVTVGSITAMLQEDRKKAHAAGQIGAAVSASMGLAKLHGLIIDRGRAHVTSESLRSEPVSETARWIEEMLSVGEHAETREKLQ